MQRTIGQSLRTARESKGLTLQEVAQKTRIPTGRLQQLEDDNFAAFGSMAYARAFLKSYSRFLDVDASEVLEGLPAPVLGGSSDYRYLTETQGHWIGSSGNLAHSPQRQSLVKSARSPIPTLVFMFAAFVVVGVLFASHLVERQKSGQAPAEVKDVSSTSPAGDAAHKGAEITETPSVPDSEEDIPGLHKETVARAVLPSSIPAPVSPNTPVRKPEIVR